MHKLFSNGYAVTMGFVEAGKTKKGTGSKKMAKRAKRVQVDDVKEAKALHDMAAANAANPPPGGALFSKDGASRVYRGSIYASTHLLSHRLWV